MQETLLTAARRVVRFIRVDDEHSGGLLSIDTIQAVDTLAKMIEQERGGMLEFIKQNYPEFYSGVEKLMQEKEKKDEQ